MRQAKPVSAKAFLAHVDMTPLLDEGETAQSFLAEALRSDPGAGVYRSWWGGMRCWFLQAAGFEFIFVQPPLD